MEYNRCQMRAIRSVDLRLKNTQQCKFAGKIIDRRLLRPKDLGSSPAGDWMPWTCKLQCLFSNIHGLGNPPENSSIFGTSSVHLIITRIAEFFFVCIIVPKKRTGFYKEIYTFFHDGPFSSIRSIRTSVEREFIILGCSSHKHITALLHSSILNGLSFPVTVPVFVSRSHKSILPLTRRGATERKEYRNDYALLRVIAPLLRSIKTFTTKSFGEGGMDLKPLTPIRAFYRNTTDIRFQQCMGRYLYFKDIKLLISPPSRQNLLPKPCARYHECVPMRWINFFYNRASATS